MTSTAARWISFTLWAVVAASTVAWGLRLFGGGPAVPPHAQGVAQGQALRGDPSRLLGAPPPRPSPAALPPASSRFALLGVLAPRAPDAAAEGLAVIAVDGKPARAYRVGALVDGDLELKRVRAKGADLGPQGAGGASMALELPPLPPPATGSLPRAVSGGGVARPLPPPRVLPRRPMPAPVPLDGNGEPAGADESPVVEPGDSEEAPESGDGPAHEAASPRTGIVAR